MLLFRGHAEQEAHETDMPDQQLVQDQDQGERDHGNNQEFRQVAHFHRQDEPADDLDDRLVEQKEGQDGFIAVAEEAIGVAQVLGPQAHDEDDCAEGDKAHCDLPECE